MGESFFIFLLILIALAAFARDDFAFHLLYLFAGAYLVSRWWSRRSLSALRIQRDFTPRAFPDEIVPVTLRLHNTSRLPLVWLRMSDNLPLEISDTRSFQQIISLAPRSQLTLNYTLQARKRGCYPVGPFQALTGDLLGLTEEQSRSTESAHLTVYPRIVPLTELGLPSRAPLGTLRHSQPIFEDPTRPIGKRDYAPGDSLRRVDWKTSAATRRLQVKQFEPSIDLQTSIFLNLNHNEYHPQTRLDAIELAIVAAASVANWVIERKQPVGLFTNGIDPHSTATPAAAQPIPAAKGRAHLMRLLETLARIQSAETTPLVQLLHSQTALLGWGATLVLITGQPDEPLLDQILRARRAGLNAVLLTCGTIANFQAFQQRAARIGVPIHALRRTRDLAQWQGAA
ncbi:MAG: DUF58 domain-containing protein [Anaerolineales bacterium]